MRRRSSLLLLSTILILALLVGCGGQETGTTTDESSEAPTGGELKDGIYLEKDPVSDHGNYGMAIMEVENGEIVSFKYAEILANSGEEKSEDNYNYPEGLAVIANLNEQFNEKKDLNEIDFDAVSGATHTKEAFKDMVNRLLVKAEKGETYTPPYKDGEYTAKAEEDSHGWLGQVVVVVRDGQIVGLDYFETAVEDMESSKVVFDEDNKPVTDSDGKPKLNQLRLKLERGNLLKTMLT